MKNLRKTKTEWDTWKLRVVLKNVRKSFGKIWKKIVEIVKVSQTLEKYWLNSGK